MDDYYNSDISEISEDDLSTSYYTPCDSFIDVMISVYTELQWVKCQGLLDKCTMYTFTNFIHRFQNNNTFFIMNDDEKYDRWLTDNSNYNIVIRVHNEINRLIPCSLERSLKFVYDYTSYFVI